MGWYAETDPGSPNDTQFLARLTKLRVALHRAKHKAVAERIRDAVDRFQSDPDVRISLCNPIAAVEAEEDPDASILAEIEAGLRDLAPALMVLETRVGEDAKPNSPGARSLLRNRFSSGLTYINLRLSG